MSTQFLEVPFQQAKNKVACPAELESLRRQRIYVEQKLEILFTNENRRKGIQVVVLNLLRCYQTTFQFGNLPFTDDRRIQFDRMKKNINELEIIFDKRFVNPGPSIMPSLPDRPAYIPPARSQSRLHSFLSCVLRQ